MLWDSFSLVIVVAAIGAAGYLCAEFRVYKSIESPTKAAAVFIAITAVFTGLHLVKVAVEGDLSQLSPQVWRFHLSVAGVIGVGLALQYLINAVKKLLRQPPARQTIAGDSPPGNGANKEQGTNPDA